MNWKFIKAWLVIVFAATLGFAAKASILDQVGVTAFRAVSTNLNGSGITVAQPEASLTDDMLTWEINPANAYQLSAAYTYASASGTASTYPNSLGSESSHADTVGQAFYGMVSGVATNVARVDNYEADFFYSNYVSSSSLTPQGDPVVNQSFTFGALLVSAQQQADSQYDNYSDQNQTLFVSAADNYDINTNVCAPGTAYNCISVGAYDNYAYYNSLGPTIDNGRCKPDLTAIAGETSFSTPLVAGAAAVMMQAGRRGDGGNNTTAAADMRTIKALLLNGAVKPANWTNSTSSPLDARYGAGVLNLLNSYEQLIGGQHSYLANSSVSMGSAHPPTGSTANIPVLSGWDFNTNTSSSFNDSINHYYFNVSNNVPGTKFMATATLVWNRQKSQSSINNLNLFLYNCANNSLVLCSTSQVDNVEHIYVPQLAPGRYDLQVWKAGGFPVVNIVSAAETYALAWQFISSPTLNITTTGASTVLTWPTYPAGFGPESTTNLAGPNWNTNGLPASTVVGAFNRLVLNPTNAVQFFRLSYPNL